MSNPSDTLHNLDLNRYYKIYKTLHEMLHDRGYKPVKKFLNKKDWISKYIGYLAEMEDPDNQLDAFSVIDKMALIFCRDKKRLLVYFHPFDSKIAQKDMDCIQNLMAERNAQYLIIVSNNKATPKVASVLGIHGNDAQLFTETDLIPNITKHQLVPKHIRVDNDERSEILNSYAKQPDGKIHLNLLPGLSVNDPISVYYNFKVGDLIRIERPRRDGYFDITYRIVTEPINDDK